MRTVTLATLTIAIAASLAAVPAQAFWAKCLLQVDGKRLLNGRCNVEIDPDGSFTIGVGDTRKTRTTFFAYANVIDGDRNKIEGRFNSGPQSYHAENDLGTLTYDSKSECWINKLGKICWSKLP